MLDDAALLEGVNVWDAVDVSAPEPEAEPDTVAVRVTDLATEAESV